MMTTNSRLATLMLVVIYIFMMACGGGGGGGVSGGIGGSGFTAVSVGSISATGSITVNGVRYQTTGAAVNRDDGASFSEADLKVGLVVEVNGQVNADGVNGTAATVTVVTAVQGPVDQIAPATNSLTVMGQPVAIDDQTLFDDSIQPNDLSGLGLNEIVEVSGTVDPNGTIRAMRIERKAPTETLRKVRGFLDSASAPTFTINGLTIDFSTAVENDFGGNGPPVNAFVSVRGTSLLAGDTLIATVVNDETRSFANETNAEIEGFITAAAGSIFTLVSGSGTFQFQTDAGTIFEGGVAADLVIGLKVEVEGAFSGGVLIVDKISIKDGIRLREVTINTVNVAERTFTLVDLSALILRLNDQTDISDDRSPPPNGQNPTPDQLLPTLSSTDELRVRARVSNTVSPGVTELVVTELRIRDGPPSPEVRLRGPLDASPGPTGPLQILGITVTFDGATTFFDLNGEIDQATFISQVDAGSLIQAEGPLSNDNIMDATQLEIED